MEMLTANNIMGWLVALGGIAFVDLIMSGDNAVIIAMASRKLPSNERKKVIFWGSIAAVVLRVILTLFTISLLETPYLQLLGGVALLWIAVKLLIDDNSSAEHDAASSVRQAVKIIVLADLVMSMDNVLALAAVARTAAQGQTVLLIIGLLASLPLVMFGARFLMDMIERWPIIVYIGAAVLGYAAAEMIVSDQATKVFLAPYHIWLKIGLTLGVVVVGYSLKRFRVRIV